MTIQQHIDDFIESVRLTYTTVDEDLAAQLWCELADELVAEELIADEDEMPFSADHLVM